MARPDSSEFLVKEVCRIERIDFEEFIRLLDRRDLGLGRSRLNKLSEQLLDSDAQAGT